MTIFSSETSPLWLVATALGLSLIPIVIGVSTSYLKISIVLGMLRQGLGAQQVPGNLVVMALSFALSLMVMGPVLEKCIGNLQSALPNNFSGVPNKENLAAIANALTPWKEFLEQHSGEREKIFVASLGKASDLPAEKKSSDADGQTVERSSFGMLLAFLLSELKEAFSMAFVLLLPFLVIDLVVSNILVGLGMFMVSPSMITLPLKLIVFVLCDGWMMLSKGLVISYGTGNF
jgi:type III secretion protein R